VTFAVHRLTARATDFHHRDLPPEPGAWIVRVERPALVLGSRQPLVSVDGLEVVRRRSGGGAVYVEPGGTLWVDVVVPSDHPLWEHDVGRAVHWLGDVWAAALGDPAATVHRGAMVRSALSDTVCFAGLGPGEVTIGGRKAVGISQRRTREAARFQCVAYERWDPEPLRRALGLDDDLTGLGEGVGSLPTVETAFVEVLASL